jgi:hypothetical protein
MHVTCVRAHCHLLLVTAGPGARGGKCASSSSAPARRKDVAAGIARSGEHAKAAAAEDGCCLKQDLAGVLDVCSQLTA